MNGVWIEAAVISVLVVALIVSRWQVATLRARERELLAMQARAQAREEISAERAALEEAKLKQAYEEGLLSGFKSKEEESYRLGYERGLIEGEQNAERHFRVEYWTEIEKNQGYFFTSAQVVACYQLMYKNIPLGSPQRYVLEKTEAIDRIALDDMVRRVLGENPYLNAGQGDRPTIRVVKRGDAQKQLQKS